jgi:hypothetical protein
MSMVTTACIECGDDQDHCHGTVLRHTDGSIECTDLTCVALTADRHDLVLACVDTGCSCEGTDG